LTADGMKIKAAGFRRRLPVVALSTGDALHGVSTAGKMR
jgi:hypothetical protein